MSPGYMIRFHKRGGVNDWKSITDASGDVRHFKDFDDANEVKESLEVSHRDYSYNVMEYDASSNS